MISEKKLLLFENRIGYKFKNKSILLESLTHPSSLKDKNVLIGEANQFERLEFLGDRVLGLIIASLLFNKHKDLDEGDMSKKYSYLVQKNFLHKISSELSLVNVLNYNYKKNNKKMLLSILSDSVESLIGGIFIDGGYKSAFNFVNKFFIKSIWCTTNTFNMMY